MRRFILLSTLCLWTCGVAITAAAQHQHEHGSASAQSGPEAAPHTHAGENLGKVSFPTSCKAQTAPGFARGVALLHSFWYPEAERQFQAIATQDPKCSMAHWGIAMSLFHQLWDRPNDDTIARGHQEMEQAQSLAARTTPRERGYIAALSAFYGGEAKTEFLARAKAYSDGMAKVFEQNPKDEEAAAFYALSLLASEAPGDTSLANPKKAVGILNRVFEKDPNHPGLAHYIIHSCDNPQMAQEGLTAARRYASIASSSPHALHMPSHIFSRLGLWQEDAASNIASIEATRRTAATMGQADHQLHAMDFLIYADLQMGNDEAAKQVVDEGTRLAQDFNAHPDPGNMGMNDYAIVEFQSVYNIETHRWSDAAALEVPASAVITVRAAAFWAKTIGAARSGDVSAAESALKNLRSALDDFRKYRAGYPATGLELEEQEASAWVALAQHKTEEAIATMRKAADSEDERGTGEVDIPARQMLGDLLLEAGQAQEALAAYETSNHNDPNRFNTLYGAARAARKTGQAEVAARYIDQLLKTCSGAKSARIEQIRAEARQTQVAGKW